MTQTEISTSAGTKAVQERVWIDIDYLTSLAIYLSGFKDGKGNLLPLGTIVLENLWNTIHYLEGDVRFTAKRDEKVR